jgi:hypothetical protein
MGEFGGFARMSRSVGTAFAILDSKRRVAVVENFILNEEDRAD